MSDPNVEAAPVEKKPRKPRAKKVAPPPASDEPTFCACGCGLEVPRNSKTGRRPKFAKRYCQKVYHDARVMGWDEGRGEITARQFMEVQRANKNPKPESDQPPALDTLINPNICRCGCGAKAIFASAKCARDYAAKQKEINNG